MSPRRSDGAPRHEWKLGGGHHLTGVVDGPWECDCKAYGLRPKPSNLGECQTCFRPVYNAAGKRVLGEHVEVVQ